MAPLVIKAFSGEQPRVSPNLLPANGAQFALNTRLDDGALTALRTPQHVFEFPDYPGNFNSIYRYQNTWLGWNGYVSAVPGPVDTDRLYVTGDGVPKMYDGTTIYDLAVPFPIGALTTAVSGTATDPDSVIISRVYVYTYVTAFGEESEPCPASNIADWQPGQTVTLSGFAAAPTGRNITTQRIYRTQTGSSGTDLYFIAERAASASNYVDTIADDDFAEVLPSRSYNAPPDTLSGIIGMPNGMMAAFTGKDIYFCEPWIPHAWPEAYVLTVDYDIVALAAIGTMLLILTTGHPYIASGTDPTSMQMMRVESNLPCLSAYGVVDLGYSIAYPSHEGLVLITPDGNFTVITKNLFNRSEWQQFEPSTLVGGQISGRYVGAYNSLNPDGSPLIGTMIIDPNGASPFLVRSDVSARAFFYDIASGSLYFLTDTGDIQEFDPLSAAPLNYVWKSRPTLLPAGSNYSCILIDAVDELSAAEIAAIDTARTAAIAANTTMLASPLGSEINGAPLNTYAFAGDGLELLPPSAPSVSVSVIADGETVANVTDVGAVQRLPSGFRARKWEVEVSGTMRVEQIALGMTIDELRIIGPG